MREALDAVNETGGMREALNAVNDTSDPEDDGPLAIFAEPRRPSWRELAARAKPVSRRAVMWAGGLITAALAVVIGSLVYGWLSSH
jgi:hypothetical protein